MTPLLVLAPTANAAGNTQRSAATAARAANARTTGAPGTEWTSGTAATVSPAARTAASARTTRPPRPAWLLARENERPLVVVVAPLIQPDRFLFALADDAEHAPRDDGSGTGERIARTKPARRRAGLTRLQWRRPAAANGLASLPGNRPRRRDRNEVLPADRILVFLPQVTSLHQHVDTGRKGAIASLEQADGADVLLPAEDELFFLLPLGIVTPHGERDGHQDRHHRERDEQRGHRVAPVSAEASARRRALTP
jgi:hypothetical protein